MCASLLHNRRMRVKIGNILSQEKCVMGGAVQGSVLGVLDHNAVIEFVDDKVSQGVYKYIDDLSLTEERPQGIESLMDNSGGY